MDIWMELCSSGMLADHPFGHLAWQKLLHYTLPTTVQRNVFIPAVRIAPLTSTILYCSLPGGHRVSAKQNLLSSFSPKLFV